MNSPKCSNPINEYQHFCSNCGNNLDDKTRLFQQHKKAVEKAFLSTCKDTIGEHGGCCKLGKAAWFIATNTDANFDYLQGEKIGCAESYTLLDAAVKDNLGDSLYKIDVYRPSSKGHGLSIKIHSNILNFSGFILDSIIYIAYNCSRAIGHPISTVFKRVFG